jgi:hypothetical protein
MKTSTEGNMPVQRVYVQTGQDRAAMPLQKRAQSLNMRTAS